MSTIGECFRRVARTPDKWLSYEVERCTRANSEGTTEPALRQSIADLARECRVLWVMQVSACAFIGVTVLGIPDSAVFAPEPRFQLPVAGVAVGAKGFFALAPLFLVALIAYLQLHLGHLHHLLRRLLLLPRREASDPDLLYPWLGVLAGPGGAARAALRFVWHLLSWWLVPGTLLLCFVRVLPLSADIYAPWGIHLLPAGVLYCSFLIASYPVLIWVHFRRLVDERIVSASSLGAPPPARRRTRWNLGNLESLLFTALVLALTAAIPYWRHRCDSVAPSFSHYPICSVDLSYLRQEGTSGQTVAGRPLVANLANLVGANLQHAVLATAEFRGAVLAYANFDGADIARASFVPWVSPENRQSEDGRRRIWAEKLAAALTPDEPIDPAVLYRGGTPEEPEMAVRTRFFREGQFDEWSKRKYESRATEMSGSSLVGARATGAHFDEMDALRLNALELNADGAIFDGATISDGRFSSASLRGASFRATDVEQAEFKNARLKGADLLGARAAMATFLSAQLHGARLRAGHFEGAIFDDAILDGADLREAHLEGAYFRRSSLRAADLRGAYVQGATFTEVDFSGADLRGWRTGVLDESEASKTWTSAILISRAFNSRVGKATEITRQKASSSVCDAVETGLGLEAVSSDEDCDKVRSRVLNEIAKSMAADEWLRPRPTWLRWFTPSEETASRGQRYPFVWPAGPAAGNTMAVDNAVLDGEVVPNVSAHRTIVVAQ